jgi:hypothetical protein
MKFAFIHAEKARWPVEVQCGVFGVSRSGYYAWKGRPEAPRAQEDAELVIEIKVASEVGRGNYGSPRVHRELRAQGRRIGRKRVERLMRQEGIVARKKRRFRKTTTRITCTRSRRMCSHETSMSCCPTRRGSLT